MKKHRFLHGLLLALPLAVVACGTTPEAGHSGVPDWVLSTPEDLRYAYGVGSAPARGDQAHARRVATDRARSDLIQNLRVTVSGTTRSWVERVREDGAGPVTRGFAEEVQTRVPDTTLDELEVAEIVLDESDNTLYVLVRLDRPSATMRLSNELGRLRDRLDAFDNGQQSAQDRLAALRQLKPALALFAEAEALESQLSLVSRQPAVAAPVAESHAHILDQLRQALDALRIRIDDSEMSERVVSGLRAGLLEQGLRVGGDQEADLIIGGSLSVRTVARDRDHFAFAEGRVEVKDADGRLLGQFNHQLREGSTDPGLAEDRVLARLGESLGRALGENLLGFL